VDTDHASVGGFTEHAAERYDGCNAGEVEEDNRR